MLLLKNIFTSNSLCRIGISRCPPFPGCDWVSSPLIFLFSGFLVHRSTSALDKASVLFCYMSLLTSWCYDSPDIHRPIQSLKKLISNSQIQIVAKILSDLSCTVWHDCCYRIVYRCHYRQLSAVTWFLKCHVYRKPGVHNCSGGLPNPQLALYWRTQIPWPCNHVCSRLFTCMHGHDKDFGQEKQQDERRNRYTAKTETNTILFVL